MGQKMPGVYLDEKKGTWEIDKWWRGTRFRQRGFINFEEAESWLITRLAQLRAVQLHGQREERTFDDAAAYYLTVHHDKKSIVTETYLLKSVMPNIGELKLHQIHDGTLAPYVAARLKENRSHKTINLTLAVVRRILNLAANKWRDDSGHTWLSTAPKFTLLPLIGHQREPRSLGGRNSGYCVMRVE